MVDEAAEAEVAIRVKVPMMSSLLFSPFPDYPTGQPSGGRRHSCGGGLAGGE